MAYNILLVEDDMQITEIIEDYFQAKSDNSISITVACDGQKGLDCFFEKNFDLVMLDIMLPGMDGLSICRKLRSASTVPIIFITARGSENDVLYGYSVGCDDYIVKPFSLAELYAKTNAMLKRISGLVCEKELHCGVISLNPSKFIVTVGNDVIDLPPKEFAILKMLMENENHLMSREVILTRIWGYDIDVSDRVVDDHIRKLRKALKSGGKQIKTVITKGYMISGGRL